MPRRDQSRPSVEVSSTSSHRPPHNLVSLDFVAVDASTRIALEEVERRRAAR